MAIVMHMPGRARPAGLTNGLPGLLPGLLPGFDVIHLLKYDLSCWPNVLAAFTENGARPGLNYFDRIVAWTLGSILQAYFVSNFGSQPVIHTSIQLLLRHQVSYQVNLTTGCFMSTLSRVLGQAIIGTGSLVNRLSLSG